MGEAYYRDDSVTVYHGDCLDVLRELPDASVDAVVTDPPYGLEFMGKEWDAPWRTGNGFRRAANPADADRDNVFGRQSRRGPEYIAGIGFQQWCELWAAECLRVLKPGGFLAAFGGTRTWHRLACAIEDAGFEIRDSIAWLYGSGFPKSLDVSKAIDKAAGAEREVVGRTPTPFKVDAAASRGTSLQGSVNGDFSRQVDDAGYRYTEHTAPATPAAQQWAGWGTALKPAFEPVVVARKPLAGTVAANVLQYGTGALNVDGCRVAMTDEDGEFIRKTARPNSAGLPHEGQVMNRPSAPTVNVHSAGRWPPNVVLDPAAAAELDRQSGVSASPKLYVRTGGADSQLYGEGLGRKPAGFLQEGYGDSGGAARFFPIFRYEAKAPTAERPRVAKEGGGNGTQNYGGYKVRACDTCDRRFPATEPQNCGHEGWSWQEPLDRQPGHVSHPTVKPLDLMRWLVRLVTPPAVTVPVCLSCGTDVHGMRIDVHAEPARAATVQHRVPTEAGRPVQEDAAASVPDVREPDRREDADLLLDPVSGGRAAAPDDHVSAVRGYIPPRPGEAEVLLEGVRGSRDGAPAEGVRTLLDDIPADRQQEPLLFAELLREGVRPREAEGPDANGAGLPVGVRARASDGNANGIHPPAPQSDGRAPRKASRPRRGRAPQERDQDGQPAGEPRGPLEGGARPDLEAATEADQLPALRGSNRGLGSCAHCGGALTEARRPGVVLDPFAGSGTTAEACLIEGFRCITVEREAEYLPLIMARLSKPIEPVLDLGGFA